MRRGPQGGPGQREALTRPLLKKKGVNSPLLADSVFLTRVRRAAATREKEQGLTCGQEKATSVKPGHRESVARRHRVLRRAFMRHPPGHLFPTTARWLRHEAGLGGRRAAPALFRKWCHPSPRGPRAPQAALSQPSPRPERYQGRDRRGRGLRVAKREPSDSLQYHGPSWQHRRIGEAQPDVHRTSGDATREVSFPSAHFNCFCVNRPHP